MVLKEREFYENIKCGNFSKFYIFYGEEGFLIKSAIKKILNISVSKDLFEFNNKKLFFDDFSFDEIEAFLNLVPLCSLKRVLVLKDVDISKISAADINNIKNILQNMPDSSIFIVTLKFEEANIKKNTKFKKLLSLYENSTVVEFNLKTKNWLINSFAKRLKEKGFLISRQNMDLLICRCCKSIEAISMELGKICAFLGHGEIKKEHILLFTRNEIKYSVFDIAKNLLAGRRKQAVEIFYNIYNEGVNIYTIFGAITACFVDFYRAKCAKLCGVGLSGLLECYNYKGKEFRIKNAFLLCNEFSIEILRKYVVLLFNIDSDLKTKSISEDVLFRKLLFNELY